MDSVFIVRPFGSNRPVIRKDKEGNPTIEYFDFDKVETLLMAPAIAAAGMQGGTTLNIFESGEVKEDMFQLLLTADVVIADITIHNANVFYELGIRHALRCKTTILIKASGFDETPFDILGYRYISYQKEDPSAALPTLISFMRDSPSSVKKDSPVFNMLPKLSEQDTESFMAMPPDFSEEAAIAAGSKRVGKLALLAQEASFFPWEIVALRYIGEELYKLKALSAAQVVWEKIKADDAADFQANDRLTTIYQRLAEAELGKNPEEAAAFLTRSDLAIENLLANHPEAPKQKRAEIAALKGRNAKTKWINSWRNGVGNKPLVAMRSSQLQTAYENYERGFYEDLNHFYSGINALSLLTIITQLAELQPTAWLENFDTDEEAARELEAKKRQLGKLTIAVQLALEAERKRLQALGKNDIWLDVTEADFLFLTSKMPNRVANRYKIVFENGDDFLREAAVRQLNLFKELGVLADNVAAVFSGIDAALSAPADKTHFILFTGHMIDKADRPEPRFPASKEAAAREKIKEKLTAIKSKIDGPLLGIAGGACGGDILFQELCSELDIPSELYLALPPDKFKKESVTFAGAEWIDRFDDLAGKKRCHILCDSKEMPQWLHKKKDYTIWERNNLWMLHSALRNDGMYLTLVALWDGKGGDGPGGTEHMVKQAKERGAKVVLINTTEL